MNIFLQAKEQNLTTGLKRTTGKGDRVIVVGIGGEDGFVDSKVYLRNRPKTKGKKEKVPQNPKDDMSMHSLFSIFTILT